MVVPASATAATFAAWWHISVRNRINSAAQQNELVELQENGMEQKQDAVSMMHRIQCVFQKFINLGILSII